LRLSEKLDNLYRYLQLREPGPSLATIAGILEQISEELEDLKDRVRAIEQEH
jgi:hypothetical protein